MGDLVEPRRLELRDDSLAKRGADPQEGVLDGILGLLAGTQLAEAVPEDLVAVLRI